MLTPLLAMVRKDLQLFLGDRRALVVSFAVPIAIASFFGAVFPGTVSAPARIPIVIVDADGSAISKAVVAGAEGDASLRVTTAGVEEARNAVRRGTATVGVVLPRGFGDAVSRAFRSGADRPALDLLYDPSHGLELAMVRGIVTEHVVRAVTGGFAAPYTVREHAITTGARVAYNGYAHAFAGMGVQFLLFATANLGIEILLERQRGLWKRLRAAPISRATLLAARAVSMAIVALTTLLVSFGFTMAVFGVRIHGSVAGFLAVAAACAVMAATFGLVIAAVGATPAATRGVTTLAVLVMVMLGGAWVPTFVFPSWLARLTVIVPPRWAVDGLDAMTWRGLGWTAAVGPSLALLGFATLFWTIAVRRFRWDEA